MSYHYRLHPKKQKANNSYSLDELEKLTTLQLRDICNAEKIVVESANRQNRRYLIDKIYKFRGKKKHYDIHSLGDGALDEIYSYISSHIELVDIGRNTYLPERLTIFTDADKTVDDKCVLNNLSEYGRNLLLLDEQNQVQGILNKVEENETEYLCCNCKLIISSCANAIQKKYKLGFLEPYASQAFYNFFYGIAPLKPMKYSCYIKEIQELLFAGTSEARATLVIDFGSCNTAAGSYIDENNYHDIVKKELVKSGVKLNDVNKVKFTTMENQKYETIPTLVSVKSCGTDGSLLLRFGYEAKHYAQRNSFDGKATCFYNIKKWVNNFNNTVQVYDEEGNFAVVEKREILFQYFQYIIQEAQRQHKCRYRRLHITCPVKQKQQYVAMYQYVLGNQYEVEQHPMDEGIAVLYNTISNQMEQEDFEAFEKYKALIIDCGGGTTDLTSCHYTISVNQITYGLNIKTIYANGDVNFGGNNITFRIFQYLKILFANYYKNGNYIAVSSLIEAELPEVYQLVDKYGIGSVYSMLEKYYDDAENVVPTKFNSYVDRQAQLFHQVRSNFYFLWHLAEQIKIDFYQGNGVAYTQFHQQGLKRDNNSEKIIAEQTWKINVFVGHDLQLKTDLPQLLIVKDEISLLITADIYGIIKKFIEPFYQDEALADLNLIKLTGQTCKIEIFRDALKEFIPGRMIATTRKANGDTYFKLTCVEGAVKFENAKKIGLISPSLTSSVPYFTYSLTSTNFKGDEITLLAGFQNIHESYGFVSRNIDTQKVIFNLVGSEGNILHQYHFFVYFEDFWKTSYEETGERAEENGIRQDDIDNISENEMKVFVYTTENKWGFTVLPIARKDGILFIGEEKFYPFENDEWELDFFDGMK